MSFPLCQATWGDIVQSPRWTKWKRGPSLGQETNEAEGRSDRRPGSVVLERDGCSTRLNVNGFSTVVLFLMFSARCFLCSCNGTLLTTYLGANYGTVCSPNKYFMISVLCKFRVRIKIGGWGYVVTPPVTELVGTV